MTLKLSICIATFNRGRFIGETLDNIAAQLVDGVELVVLDGASTDNTEAEVRKRLPGNPRLRYYRQGENRGFDRDFDTVVEKAAGEYCWLMSDDDLFLPGALQRVLDTLSGGYGVILVNSEAKDMTLTRMLEANRLDVQQDRVYAAAEHDRLFADLAGAFGYVGAIILRRDLWLARDRAAYYGSFFVHAAVVLQQPIAGGTRVIAEPLVSVRIGNTQWRSREFEIRMVRWTDMIWALPGVAEDTKRRHCPREPWKSVKSLFFYRAKGTYSMEEYERWVKPRAAALRDRVRAIAVALIPGVLANLVGLLYCSFSYRESKVHLVDMKRSRYYFRNWGAGPPQA